MGDERIGETYVRLALALDQHIPGYVDAYFGPSAWQEAAHTAGARPLPELVQQAATLANAIADTDTLGHQRQDYLARQVATMQTSLRLLQGETMALADAVEGLYDVRPTWVDEGVFAEMHYLLTELLPAGNSLHERMARRKQALEISVDQVQQLLPLIQQHLRQLTAERFGLPAHEALEVIFVQDQPWMAYNCLA